MSQDESTPYHIITERLIAALEAGTAPWQKPWSVRGGGMPSNFVSRKPYRGINVFSLLCAGFECPFWLTYKQAAALGGQVRKGSKGMPVTFWSLFGKKDANGKPVIGPDGKPEKIGFLRYYTVFNVEQCDGLDYVAPAKVESTFDPIPQCAAIVEGMPQRPAIEHSGGSHAFYSPAGDMVNMPPVTSFPVPAAYYSVLFHELTHATGHETRLGRVGVMKGEAAAFGSGVYGREELVAEMGAAFLCGHAGVLNRTFDNSAAYLASWIKTLKADPKLAVQAAGQAQKATDFILGTTFEPDEE